MGSMKREQRTKTLIWGLRAQSVKACANDLTFRLTFDLTSC